MYTCQGKESGFTVLELMVGLSILAILSASAVSYVQPKIYNLESATKELTSNLRLARAYSLSRGVHYRILIAGNSSYRIERLREAAGAWEVDPAEVRVVDFPSTVQFADGVGTTIEFNTRGFVVQPTALFSLTLRDSSSGRTRVIDVWPSAQVTER